MFLEHKADYSIRVETMETHLAGSRLRYPIIVQRVAYKRSMDISRLASV